MTIVWGIVVLALALLAWAGQTLAWLAPPTAERLSLTDAEADVDPAFYADVRGEARWDAFSLWTLVVAGVLLIVDSPAWPYFGLVGGGMFLYFAGRGISTRVAAMRRSIRIGTPSDVRVAFVALSLWGLTAAITIVASVAELRG